MSKLTVLETDELLLPPSRKPSPMSERNPIAPPDAVDVRSYCLPCMPGWMWSF